MPSPEVWGPTTWALFHTLAEHMREDAFHSLGRDLFQKIVSICSALPCPQCTEDATTTLRKVRPHDIDTRKKLIDTLYLFHNYVNAKKNKPLFDYSRVASMYRDRNVINTFQHFASNYHTKGNMRMMNDSFRRESIVKDVQQWLKRNFSAFVIANIQAPPAAQVTRPKPVVSPQAPESIPVGPHPAVEELPPMQEIEEIYAGDDASVEGEGVSMVMREK